MLNIFNIILIRFNGQLFESNKDYVEQLDIYFISNKHLKQRNLFDF